MPVIHIIKGMVSLEFFIVYLPR